MGDRAPEDGRRPRRVDMDELVIVRAIGEVVDLVLRDLEPVASRAVVADQTVQLLEGGCCVAHAFLPGAVNVGDCSGSAEGGVSSRGQLSLWRTTELAAANSDRCSQQGGEQLRGRVDRCTVSSGEHKRALGDDASRSEFRSGLHHRQDG